MYAELQVTTNYSFLRSGSHPGELALQALALGHTAIGIADRNTLAGVVRAYAAIKEYYEELPEIPEEERFKLLVGARLETRDGYSLIAYPTDLEAYKRLSRLLTVGNRRAAKGECDLTFDDLASHAEGILAIVLPPRRPEDPAFRERLRALARLFGDRCYLAGTMLFRGDDARRLALLDNLAAEMRVRLVATNDVHYHVPERRALHDVVTAIRLGCTVDALGFRRFASAERHLKEPKEMARLFRRHPHAIERTQEIVERCRFSLDQLTYQYPVMYEGGETPMDKLARLTWEGAAWRYPEGVPEEVAKTIRHEFELIDRKQIAPYFLTVHEIVWQAREMGILCQGRGSAANSAVCYCLGITSVDPGKIDGPVRALPVQRAQRAARHRRRFRARAARGRDPVDLRRERPHRGRAGGHGDRLSKPQRHSRGRQGARPVARHGGRDGRYGVGHGVGRRRRQTMCARPASIPPILG